MVMTVRELFAVVRRRLQRKYPDHQARWWAALLIEERLGLPRGAHLLMPQRAVTAEDVAAVRKDAAAVAAGRPLQQVLGWWEFRGLRLKVTADVLIPRPETEWLVEGVLQMVGADFSGRVWDVGTGSGCIAVAVKTARPSAAVYGFEVSAPALAVARENAALHGAAVRWVAGDFLDAAVWAAVPGPEVLISNPPYLAADDVVAPSVRDYEPPGALFPGADVLVFYRELAAVARQRRPAVVGLEVNPRFRKEIQQLFADYRPVMPAGVIESPYLLFLERDVA